MSPLPLRRIGRSDAALAGRKAAALGELLRAGFPVPDGFVVLPSDAPGTIAAETARLAGPFAVRSSGTAEDTAGASFAGLYETALDAAAADVPAAVAKVRASGTAQRVAAYAGAAVAPIPVLVQRLVRADAAGVAFTADPVTGEREATIVSAVRGIGERLVSGLASADEWVVREGVAIRRLSGHDVIDADLARRVSDLARRVEVRMGVPQDVEWAIAGDDLFLLQARPMTALPEPVSWKAPAGAWVRNYRIGEWLGHPVTPLFESWAVERIEPRLRPQVQGKLHCVVNGWYFYAVDWFPPVPDRAVAQLTEGAAAGGISRFIIRPSPEHLAHDLREWRLELSPAHRRAVHDAESAIATAPFERLLGLVDALLDHAGELFGSICIVGGAAWKAELDLAEFYRHRLVRSVGGSHLDLLGGLRASVFAPHAVESLDWYFPTAGERGVPPDGDAEARRKRLEVRRVDAERRARAALQSAPRLLAEFDVLLREAQGMSPIREEQSAELTLGWPALRRALRRIGEHLVARGDIARPDHVFFLRRDELETPVDRRTVTASRMEQWRLDARLSPPLVIGRMSRYWEAYWRVVADAGRGPGSEPGALQGAPASPGRATGLVRIVRSADEFGRLAAGEVLVCPVTTPAWTTLFGRAAAVVTDTGSAASHASIVAREYGIPAVVGTVDATKRLRDGQRVTVDGSAGVVVCRNGPRDAAHQTASLRPSAYSRAWRSTPRS